MAVDIRGRATMGSKQAVCKLRTAFSTSAFVLLLATGAAAQADGSTGYLSLSNGALGLMVEAAPETASAPAQPYPLMTAPDAGLDFDLGGSEKRKLQLQLAQPLSLHSGLRAQTLDDGSDILGLDATLSMPLSDEFSLTARTGRAAGNSRFQPLGSIRCMNGTLRADSYTASGCRFVTEPIASTDQRRIDLGASMDFGNASASVGWFEQRNEMNQSSVSLANQPQAQVTAGRSFLSPNLVNPLLDVSSGDPLQYLNSEASGVDLNFKVGIATTNAGDIRLGLAFSHVLDSEFQGLYGAGEAFSWTVAEPFNSSRMNLEWSRGAFSGGVQGFYRDSVDFLNRNSLDSLTTFDVHFTWRTPWNADLTVGATNVLDVGAEVSTSADKPPVDPLESVYGRIPYVRYKQDL